MKCKKLIYPLVGAMTLIAATTVVTGSVLLQSCSSTKQNNNPSTNNFIKSTSNNQIVKSNETITIDQLENTVVENWYFSTNENLENSIDITKSISKSENSKVSFKLPNYVGECYVYGQLYDGKYTNPIKIDMIPKNNSEIENYFNVKVLGCDKSSSHAYYKDDNGIFKPISLWDGSSNSISADELDDLYNLARKYADLFQQLFSKLDKSIVSQIKSDTETTILDESILVNLPKILDNFSSNWYISGVNFINSSDSGNQHNIDWSSDSSIRGLQIVVCSKNDANLQFVIAVSANVKLTGNIGESYLDKTYDVLGNETTLFNSTIDMDNFFSNSNVDTKKLSSLIMSVDYVNLPTEMSDEIKQGVNDAAKAGGETTLYYQVLASKILAKKHANKISNYGDIYPGIDFNPKNFNNEVMGYINASQIQWGNPFFMGWSKYSKILSSTLKASTESQKALFNSGNKSVNNQNFVMNLFDKTNYQDVETLDVDENKIITTLTDDTSLKIPLGPTGLMGLMQVSHYLSPMQNLGLSLSGNQWEFFGYKQTNSNASGLTLTNQQLSKIDENINKIVKSIINIYTMFDLDCLDIDYEYPISYGNDTADKQMSDKFAIFIQKMKKGLATLSVATGKNYKLSACVNQNWKISYDNWLKRVNSYVDTFNFMAYDVVDGRKSQIASGNSKGRSIVGGQAKLRSVLTDSNETVQLYNHVTKKYDTVQKVKNYTVSGANRTDNVNFENSLSVVAGDGAMDSIDNIVQNYGIPKEKVVVGLGAYVFSWKITIGNGPLENLPGNWGIQSVPVISGQLDQYGLSRYFKNIKPGGTGDYKVYFDPYTITNYIYNANTHEYSSLDFVESTIVKRNWVNEKNYKGVMVWTMNSQNNPEFNDNKFDFSTTIKENGLIANYPVLATMSGMYSDRKIYEIWKNNLSPNFLDNFGEIIDK